jgi:hypothetical protein
MEPVLGVPFSASLTVGGTGKLVIKGCLFGYDS